MKPATAKERVRCRLISEGDLAAVTDLLCEGFSGRARANWTAGLMRMSARNVPDGMPRYGYCLDAGGRLVGVILLLASRRETGAGTALFANVASWYVQPDYRAYAQLLVSIALRNKDVTYTNVSPAPHTWSIIENQGYTRYCNGLFFALGLLTPPVTGVRLMSLDTDSHQHLPDFDLLKRHHDLGCSVVVADDGSEVAGYVFRRYRIRGGRLPLPAMFAVHAPDRAALVRIAGNVSRYFITKAAPIIVFNSDAPVAGLRGFFTTARGRKYFKGPHNPGLCRLADSEYAIFGV